MAYSTFVEREEPLKPGRYDMLRARLGSRYPVDDRYLLLLNHTNTGLLPTFQEIKGVVDMGKDISIVVEANYSRALEIGREIHRLTSQHVGIAKYEGCDERDLHSHALIARNIAESRGKPTHIYDSEKDTLKHHADSLKERFKKLGIELKVNADS